jgi:hypothetical protein
MAFFHGTPFDSIDATNASLLALLTDQPLPPRARWVRDTPASTHALILAGSIAEEHATARLPQLRPALNAVSMSSSSGGASLSALSPSSSRHFSAVMGRANRNPCPTVQPRRRSISTC